MAGRIACRDRTGYREADRIDYLPAMDKGRSRRIDRRTPPTGAPTRAARPWASSLAALGLILCATLALHARGLFAPFFGDDLWFLDDVRGRSLGSALTDPSPIGPFFRPWSTKLHWWLLSRLAGEHALPFHAVNLALFAGIVTLVFLLARRLFGARAGMLAAAIVAIHPAPEAAVRWVSGSQDLWATLAALACLLLHVSGRRGLAAVALLVALFSKETAILTPLVAVLIDRRAGEPWWGALRRAGGLAVALALWGVAWVPAFTSSLAGTTGDVVAGPEAVPAALWHFVCVLCGLEGTPATAMGFPAPGLMAVFIAFVALVGVGLILAGAPPDRSELPTATLPPWTLGIAALLAALPVAAVVSVWSAYQYTSAICFAAVGMGGFLARRRAAWVVTAAIVLALGAWRGWGIEEMEPRAIPWKALSRVNGFYLRRGEAQHSAYLAALKRLRPTLPPHSTVLFAGLPAFAGWQSGDGAVLRWAYADTTLRSRFISQLSAADTLRGPVYFFTAAGGDLHEIAGPARYRHVAYGLLLSDALDGVEVAVALALRESPDDAATHYLRAWLALWRGDSLAARAFLLRANVTPAGGPIPGIEAIEQVAAGGELERAIQLISAGLERHQLDPRGHALLADLLLQHPDGQNGGTIEAFAARALSPHDWTMWKRWGLLQARTSRERQAQHSLERAQALQPGPQPDAVLVRVLAGLRQAETR